MIRPRQRIDHTANHLQETCKMCFWKLKGLQGFSFQINVTRGILLWVTLILAAVDTSVVICTSAHIRRYSYAHTDNLQHRRRGERTRVVRLSASLLAGRAGRSRTGSSLVAKPISKLDECFSTLTHTEYLEEHYFLFVKCWMFGLWLRISNNDTNRSGNCYLKNTYHSKVVKWKQM